MVLRCFGHLNEQRRLCIGDGSDFPNARVQTDLSFVKVDRVLFPKMRSSSAARGRIPVAAAVSILLCLWEDNFLNRLAATPQPEVEVL